MAAGFRDATTEKVKLRSKAASARYAAMGFCQGGHLCGTRSKSAMRVDLPLSLMVRLPQCRRALVRARLM